MTARNRLTAIEKNMRLKNSPVSLHVQNTAAPEAIPVRPSPPPAPPLRTSALKQIHQRHDLAKKKHIPPLSNTYHSP